jgi:hypothetical protein
MGSIGQSTLRERHPEAELGDGGGHDADRQRATASWVELDCSGSS